MSVNNEFAWLLICVFFIATSLFFNSQSIGQLKNVMQTGKNELVKTTNKNVFD